MNFNNMEEVTDPNVLAQLNNTKLEPITDPNILKSLKEGAYKEVTDPNVLAQLNNTTLTPHIAQTKPSGIITQTKPKGQSQQEEGGFLTGLMDFLNPVDKDELKMDFKIIGDEDNEANLHAKKNALFKAFFNTLFHTKDIKNIATSVGNFFSDDNDNLTSLENIVSKINNDTDLKLNTQAGLDRFQKMASTLGFSKLLKHKQTGQAWIYNPSTGDKYPISRILQGQKDAGFIREMFQNMANNPKTTFMSALPIGGRAVSTGLGWGKSLANAGANALEMGAVTTIGKALDNVTNSEKSMQNQLKDLALEGVAGTVGQGAFDGAGAFAGWGLQAVAPNWFKKANALDLGEIARQKVNAWNAFIRDKVPVGGGRKNALKASWDNVSDSLKPLSIEELKAIPKTNALKDEADLAIAIKEALPVLGVKEELEKGKVVLKSDPDFKGDLRADEVSKAIQEINFKDLSLSREYKKFISSNPKARTQAQQQFRDMLTVMQVEMDRAKTAGGVKETISNEGIRAKTGLDDIEEELANKAGDEYKLIDYNINTNPNAKDYNIYTREGLGGDSGVDRFSISRAREKLLKKYGDEGMKEFRDWGKQNTISGQANKAVSEYKEKSFRKSYLAKQIKEKTKLYNALTRPKKTEGLDEFLNRSDLPEHLRPHKEAIKTTVERLDKLNAETAVLDRLRTEIIKSNSNAEYLKAFKEVLGSQVKEDTDAVEYFLKRKFGDLKGLTPTKAKEKIIEMEAKGTPPKNYLLSEINQKIQDLKNNHDALLIDPATGEEYQKSKKWLDPLVKDFTDFRAKAKPEDVTKTDWAKDKLAEIKKLENEHQKISEEIEGQTVASVKEFTKQAGVKQSPLMIQNTFKELLEEIRALRRQKRALLDEQPNADVNKLKDVARKRIKAYDLREQYLLDEMKSLTGEEGFAKLLKANKGFAEYKEFLESDLGKHFDDEVSKETYANTMNMLNTMVKDIKQLARDESRGLPDTMKFIKNLIERGESKSAFKLEKNIQDALIQDMLKIGQKDGRANYRKLLDDLSLIEMQTPEGKALLEERIKAFNSMQALADIIDTKFERLIRQLSQGISPNPLTRIHTMWGNYVINNFKKYIPSEEIGQIPAVMYHTGEALRAKAGARKGLNTIDGVITNVKELAPNARDEAKKMMEELYAKDTKWAKGLAKAINLFVRRDGDPKVNSAFVELLSNMYKTMSIMRKTFNRATIEQAKRDAIKSDKGLNAKKGADYLVEKWNEYKRKYKNAK